MDANRIREVLQEVGFQDWRFDVVEKVFDESENRHELYLQVRFAADGQMWGGRKWKLSRHMTKSEIVQTAMKAVLTAVEHEAREHFFYRGRAIFGPHLDIDALWSAADRLDVRVSA